MELEKLAAQISAPSAAAEAEARRRWANVAKPLGSLGLLEDDIVKIAALTGTADVRLDKRAVLVFCADNGVLAQGVTQTGAEVTAAVAGNVARRRSCVCRMAARAGADVFAVDMGMLAPLSGADILNRRLGPGTADFTAGPAMSRRQAEQGIEAGIALVRDCAARGVQIIATGEMGIGNTTTSSAVAAVLLGRPVEQMTGRGAGLSDEGLRRKIDAIRRGIARNRPDQADPIDVLAKLGGFDIAGICGAFLGGALCRVPVLADGFISAVGALLAQRLCPGARAAMLASHVSAEPAGRLLLDELGLEPLITARMRLGEGTGAVAALPLLDMGLVIYHEMDTFGEIGVEAYTPQGGAQ